MQYTHMHLDTALGWLEHNRRPELVANALMRTASSGTATAEQLRDLFELADEVCKEQTREDK